MGGLCGWAGWLRCVRGEVLASTDLSIFPPCHTGTGNAFACALGSSAASILQGWGGGFGKLLLLLRCLRLRRWRLARTCGACGAGGGGGGVGRHGASDVR